MFEVFNFGSFCQCVHFQGHQVSILRLPLSMIMENCPPPEAGGGYRAPADGGHTDNYHGKPPVYFLFSFTGILEVSATYG